MTKNNKSIGAQIKAALDGRTQRWLAFEVRIAEDALSKKIKGSIDFTEDELTRIENRLNFKLDTKKKTAKI